MKISVLLPVYRKDDPAFFDEALNSVINQTMLPDEIIIIEDGPVPATIKKVYQEAKKTFRNIKIYSFKENQGLGVALKYGVEKATGDIIVRMDSDDIARPKRIEKQANFLQKHADIDILGTNITEFIVRGIPVSKRTMPETHSEIVAFSKMRSPFAHPSVAFRRDSILRAGSYKHWPSCEDYELWCRAISRGAKCHNLQEYLLDMRLDDSFYKRRGGAKYLIQILRLKYQLFTNGHSSFIDFMVSSSGSILFSLSPTFLRTFMYKTTLRDGK